jgi:hypothetical protein
MRLLFLMMNELAGRLDRRVRRLLLVASMVGLTLFARSTAAAYQGGDVVDTAAGFALVLLFAAGAALACTRPASEG